MGRDTVGSAPPNGKTFEARIHKIDSSGNGIIETTNAPDIILGPVNQDAVGKRIEAMKLPGCYARIKRPKHILPSNYINELQELVSYDFSIDYGDADANIESKQEHGYGILEYIPPWENGELHNTTIDRRSNAGNGIVYIDNRSVNIGPVREGVAGSDVSVILIAPSVGVCKTISVRAEDYFSNHIRTIDEELVDTTDYFELGRVVRDREAKNQERAVVVNLPPIPAEDYIAFHDGKKEVSVAEDNPQYDEYASVVVVIFKKTILDEYPDYTGDEPIPLETLSNNNVDHYAFPPERLEPIGEYFPQPQSKDEFASRKSEDVLAGDDSPHKYQSNLDIDSESATIDSETFTNADKTKDGASEPHTSSDIVEDSKASSESQTLNKNKESTNTDFNELRKKAQESATETVTKRSTTTTQTSQYSRSSQIREYVMARADGTCEGCSEPAPFTSKTGDPYLHAHHIHELSDGGSDTPDTVVGLCPNCHYRVHHGQDGDKYNQKLLSKVQNIEENIDSR